MSNSSSPFDFVNCINSGRDNPELKEKDYVPFLVNRTLSNFRDCVLIVNEVNRLHHLDNALQYRFLINMVRPGKRFSKWAKPSHQEDLSAVCEYYDYSMTKAQEVLKILSADQIELIKTRTKKHGGQVDLRPKRNGRDIS